MPAIASVSKAPESNGLATAMGVGHTDVTATLGTIVGTTTLTVTPAVLMSITVTPAAPSIAKGTKVQLTATGTFSDATTQDLTRTVTWASATAATATISNAAGSHGLVTSVDVGTTDISAASGGIVGHVTLTVSAAVVASIAVTPANPTIAAAHTQQFVATATLTDGTKIDVSATATWASAMTIGRDRGDLRRHGHEGPRHGHRRRDQPNLRHPGHGDR